MNGCTSNDVKARRRLYDFGWRYISFALANVFFAFSADPLPSSESRNYFLSTSLVFSRLLQNASWFIYLLISHLVNLKPCEGHKKMGTRKMSLILLINDEIRIPTP